MSKTSAINVLYVDDEENNLISFTASFRKYFNVFIAISAKEADTILTKETIHVLITDQRMPETAGTKLLEDAVKKYPDQTRIILTAYPDDENVREAEKMQLIYRSVSKPWDFEELKELIVQGYDVFCCRINQKTLLQKHSRIIKELNKGLNKEDII